MAWCRMPLTTPDEVPRFRNTARIERNALAIVDPVERLKYLRKATAVPTPRKLHWAPYLPFVLAVLLISLRSDAHLRHVPDVRLPATVIPVDGREAPNVWRVEATKDYEVYSNGLRIENQMAVANEPRLYRLLSVEKALRQQRLMPGPVPPAPPGASKPETTSAPAKKEKGIAAADAVPDEKGGRSPALQRTQPAGILFHTTESDQVPFEAAQQHNLQRITRDTLLFVRNRRAYHFLIDRFGIVHRIVVESDAANHAGNSIWADSRWLYLDLNQSFLGVAFEASMSDQQPVTPAQIHAAKVLTEMLRNKYNIPAENCVTHAQVSVNPDNMRIGWHADWGKGFPFAELHLPDNYQQPLPAFYLMGFAYDDVYLNAIGPGIRNGLAAAEARLQAAAEARAMPVAQYRSYLRKRYSDEIRALRQRGADEEN